ncbi:DUF4344 domain-containing metallopeptidase [Pseudomonas benzenivorans]|nr:DUF4344 domain-containing metallopeptidase [Pseudomonas benzenivorans]
MKFPRRRASMRSHDRHWLMQGLLCLTLLATPVPLMSSDEPPPAALRSDTARFVAVNVEFTLLHEMGHLLIAELGLPVLGREEDAADQLGFISLFLSSGRQRDAGFYAKLLDVADYWRLEWQRPKPASEEVYVWGSHGLDAQRFYNLACLIYGSDPDRLEWVPKVTGLPVERALYCDQEYAQVRKALAWVELQHGRRPGEADGHVIRVVYEPTSLRSGQYLLEQLRRSGEVEAIARRASETYRLPRDLVLRLANCGAPDAWYSRTGAELVLCYERLEHFQTLAAQLPDLRQAKAPARCALCASP